MPAKFARITCLLLLVTTSGCAGISRWWNNGFKLGPDYCPPSVNTASDWIDSQDEAVVANGEFDEELTGWWRVFDDPTMEELIVAAYQKNLSLRIIALRLQEARALRAITAANLFPQSQRHFTQFSRNQVSGETATTFTGQQFEFSDWQSGFDVSWELDVWGRLRRAIESADAAIDTETENYDTVLVTLIGDVAASYIELRAFDERIVLARKNVEAQLGSLDQAQKKWDNMVVSKLDVHQAESNLAETRALIPALEQARRQVINRLAILLGTTPYELEPILRDAGTIPTAPDKAIVGIPADLLRRRPDIRAEERTLAQLSPQIGIAEAELYPQFALSGEIKVNADNIDDLFTSNSVAAGIAPGLQWKILNYGRLTNNVRVQELRFQQQVVNLENTVLKAHREVEDALVQFVKSREQVNELEKAVTATASSVKLVRIQYEEGATDFNEVFVLESRLVQAQDRLVQAKLSVAIALTQVYKALGGGWQLRQEIPYSGEHSLTPIDSTPMPATLPPPPARAAPVLPPADDTQAANKSRSHWRATRHVKHEK